MANQNFSSKYAPVVLRLGLALVFLWFGISQLRDADAWTGFVPAWVPALSGLGAETIVTLNGWFEVVAGAFLALGFWVRPVAALLFLHLAAIVVNLGPTELGVRDFGLACATLAVTLYGEDRWCFPRTARAYES
jgi:uncharacterized membrane protein YphA (DoxX/SURF4 family)